MMSKRLLVLVLAFCLLLPVTQAQEAVVYGVFFYSPTCPHCHEVMDNHWPSIAARFGEQLQVIFVDVTTPAGRALMESALWSLNLPSSAVPQLIIGDEVMLGSVEIPERAPLIIQAGLEAGGIPYPEIPDIAAWFANEGMVNPSLASLNPLDTLSADPANALAIILLLGIVLSIILVSRAGWQSIRHSQYHLLSRMNHEFGWWVFLFGIFLGLAVVLSLLFGSSDSLVFALSSALALLFLAILIISSRKSKLEELPRYLIPLLLIVGIMASAYLSYVEMTLTEAVCGAWGNCLAVQQSDYARIAEIPVSLLGLMAYAVMFTLYIGKTFFGVLADSLLFVFTSLGLLFSLYLTFLEPFVIGASCAWCLTSTIVMLNLFWLIVPRSLGSLTLPKQTTNQYA